LRFLPTYEAAKSSEFAIWEDSVQGALALGRDTTPAEQAFLEADSFAGSKES
jgi:hypothetical protein